MRIPQARLLFKLSPIIKSLFIILLLPPVAAFAKPADSFNPIEKPADTDDQKGLTYSKTKEYQKDFAKAIKSARLFCSKYRKDNPGAKNLAIISDIDETLIDNRGLFKKIGKFNWPDFIEWIKEADAPNLKPTAKFLKWARKNGYSVFLITGRPEKLRPYTIMNLVHNDIAYDGLYMRPEKEKGDSAIKLKTRIRQELEEMGFKIVLNIGDQNSDLVGGHALDCVKLPNKMYFVK